MGWIARALAVASFAWIAATACSAAPETTWPRFRGELGAGVSDGKPLPAEWSPTSHIIWKAPVPGKGWSSPVVWGNRIFLTTAIPAGDVEKPWIPEKMEDNGKGYPTKSEQRWTVVCLDLKSGRQIWSREAHRAVPDWLTHPKGSHASESVVTDGKRVYAQFGNIGIFCYTVDGKPLWQKRWGKTQMLFNWGTAIGPALYGGRVYVVNDNEDKSWLAALDAATGKEIWRVTRDEKSNWCNPLAWKTPQRVELVTSGSRGVRSYDLDGKLLWELQGMSYATIPSPFVYKDRLYLGSGHSSGNLQPVYCIRPGATGTLTLGPEETGNAGVAWVARRGSPYVPTPIAYGDLVYCLRDYGFVDCYSAADGKSIYTRFRLSPSAMPVTASPVAGDGKIYCLGEKGNMVVLAAGPTPKVLARNDLGEDTLATPAIVDGTLLVRTLGHLYRIGAAK